MIELYQTEWCPYSSRVRQRLTELGVDYVARQVPADRQDRDDLEQLAGSRGIPVLVPDGGEPIADSEAIVAYLDEHFSEDAQSARHREKASAH